MKKFLALLLCLLLVLPILPFPSSAAEVDSVTEIQVSSYTELRQAIQDHKSDGGTIKLLVTKDFDCFHIEFPAGGTRFYLTSLGSQKRISGSSLSISVCGEALFQNVRIERITDTPYEYYSNGLSYTDGRYITIASGAKLEIDSCTCVQLAPIKANVLCDIGNSGTLTISDSEMQSSARFAVSNSGTLTLLSSNITTDSQSGHSLNNSSGALVTEITDCTLSGVYNDGGAIGPITDTIIAQNGQRMDVFTSNHYEAVFNIGTIESITATRPGIYIQGGSAGICSKWGGTVGPVQGLYYIAAYRDNQLKGAIYNDGGKIGPIGSTYLCGLAQSDELGETSHREIVNETNSKTLLENGLELSEQTVDLPGVQGKFRKLGKKNSVFFDANGGSGSVAAAEYVEGDRIPLPKVERSGCLLHRWEVSGGDTILGDKTFHTMGNTDLTLKAIWKFSIPEKPVLKTLTATSITLVRPDGVEYSVNDGETWFAGETVSSLEPNTTYQVFARMSGQGDVEASDPSLALTVTTDKLTVSAPSAPTVLSRNDVSITLEAVEGMEYSIDSGQSWQSSASFAGLNQNTEYRIRARYAETEQAYASPASSVTTVRTKQSASAAPPAPRLFSRTDTTISIY